MRTSPVIKLPHHMPIKNQLHASNSSRCLFIITQCLGHKINFIIDNTFPKTQLKTLLVVNTTCTGTGIEAANHHVLTDKPSINKAMQHC